MLKFSFQRPNNKGRRKLSLFSLKVAIVEVRGFREEAFPSLLGYGQLIYTTGRLVKRMRWVQEKLRHLRQIESVAGRVLVRLLKDCNLFRSEELIGGYEYSSYDF